MGVRRIMPGLRILIVGRGEGKTAVANGHSMEFVKSAKTNSVIISLDNCDFVFFHISSANPEASEAIKCWCNKGQKAKIIGFSGGAGLAEILAEIKNLGIPYIKDMPTQRSLLDLNWSAIPIEFSGNSNDLVKLLQIHSEFSPALAILCQGYLAAHFSRPQDAPINVRQALDTMGWTKFTETDEGKPFAQIVLKKKEVTVKPEWWQKVFENTIKGEEQPPKSLFRKKLDEELGNIELPEEIAQLVDAIFGMQPIEDTELVAIAYLKLVERLKGTA